MANILKKVTILYVEADEVLRNQLITVLDAVLKKVYISKDGLEALEIYKEHKDSIDLILTSVNIPGINGVDLLREVRAIDKTIPFMINTKYTESELLIEAIEYDVTEYVSKEIDTKELLFKIANRCYSRFSYKKMAAQDEEMTRYLDALNKVAIVSKTDVEGIITYVNEIFCEVSQYKESELLGQPHNIVRHPDVSKAVFKEMWDTIQAGKRWQGKVKNRAKDDSPYFVNATIFPQYDETGINIIGYIGIRFLTTDDENEKREFKKKVIVNLQDSRKKQLKLTNQNNKLELELKESNQKVSELEKSIISLETSLKDSQKKNMSKERQLHHYEVQMHNVDETYLEKMKTKRKEVEGRLDNIHDLRHDKDLLIKKNNKLNTEIQELRTSVLNSKLSKDTQKKRIHDLMDIVSDLEKKLKEEKD